MLQAFVDDSGSDRQGPVYLLAGYVSSISSWEKFSVLWRKVLDEEPSIEYFKMREAESRKCQFEGWSEGEVDAKIAALIPVIVDHATNRIECIFWQEHYDSAIKWFLGEMRRKMHPLEFKKIKDLFEDPYFLAFDLIMSDYGNRLAAEQSEEIVDFIFDVQVGQGPRAVEWWQGMKELGMVAAYDKYFPNEPVHRDDKLFSPLQAADMIAWQTRRRLDEFNTRNVTAARKEYDMLNKTPLFMNRWNEERLRDFLSKLI
ncbi:MAG: DUF3800 domain-containing protein [Terriglobales bacterium]